MKTLKGYLVLTLMLTAFAGCTQKKAPVSQSETEREVLLLEFGLVGCEVSDAGLLKMKDICNDKTIPGLSFLRMEGSPESESAKEYFKERDLPFPVKFDPNHRTATALKANTYPCFVLLDKHGRVRYRGSFPSDHLAEWVAELNAEKNDLGPDAPLFGVPTLDIPNLLAGTKLPQLTKSQAKSLSDYAGENGLMIVFVDTSCPFAGQVIKEMPGISKTMSKFSMPAILINTDDQEEDVKHFYSEAHTGTPVLYDTSAETRNRWCVDSVPTVIVIDASEALVYNGPALWETIALAIEKNLGLGAGLVNFTEKGTAYG